MKRKLVIIMISVTILLLTIGLTYSYFRAMIIGEGTPISAQAKGVRVIFTDNEEITDPDIIPGWKQTKRFSVKNEGTDDFEYNIVLKDLVNTFITEGFLQYKITSTNGYNMTEYVDIPKSEEAKDEILAYSVLIEPNTTQEYTLELVYHNSETVDQSEDIGSILSGKLGITEGTEKLETLADTIKTAYSSSGTRSSFDSVYDVTALHEATDYNESGSFSGTSYYFTGNPNNWVSFAGKKWRIIRINGNGSVRLLYAGSGGEDGYIGSEQTYNNSYNHPGYVGWKYSTGSSLDAIRGNANKSNAYTTVENWYNALSSTDKNYIDGNAIYCNVRNIGSGSFSTSRTFYYAGYTRLASNKTPTLECSNEADRFYNFGLMTADEVSYAGGVYGSNNSGAYYYLNASGGSSTGGNWWWTMSPSYFNWLSSSSSSTYASVFVVGGSGSFPGRLSYDRVNYTRVVRPVVSLKSSVLVTGGTGTASDPYKLTL